MGKSLKFLVPLALFAGLVALLFFGLGTDPRKVPSPSVGKPAPVFTKLDDSVVETELARLRGEG